MVLTGPPSLLQGPRGLGSVMSAKIAQNIAVSENQKTLPYLKKEVENSDKCLIKQLPRTQ